jgi:hypothetical protein
VIKYQLHCHQGHEFEGWYSDSTDFDTLKAAGKLMCGHYPDCNSHNIEKSIMAPNVVRSGTTHHPSSQEEAFMEQVRAHILKHSVDVGDNFANEVRKADPDRPQALRGQASFEEARELVEEGHLVFRIPDSPKAGLN